MNPLVSVIIPTRNSEATIQRSLRSASHQTHRNVEVIVVDSFSRDRTREIAESFGAEIVITKEKLLGARYTGLNRSKGKYILLLDSDQILDKTAIARALETLNEYDMLCLEEHSYHPKTWIQRLFEADRRLIHNLANVHLDPLRGILLARFFRRELLEKAFEAVPREILPIVVAHDHAIINYEAYRISQKVGVLPKAVWHIEPSGLIELWKKNYRYGKTTRELSKYGFYRDLLEKKVGFRKGFLNYTYWRYGFLSSVLLSLKAIAYQIGYWSG